MGERQGLEMFGMFLRRRQNLPLWLGNWTEPSWMVECLGFSCGKVGEDLYTGCVEGALSRGKSDRTS